MWKAIHELLDRLVQERKRRTGIVTGTSGTKVIVTVGSSSLTLQRLSSYTPVNGEVVVIDCWGDSWLVTGKVA